jgi:2,4-dienoyl-CoA reductase-like NADH-dependent reductase (Old Yellow Enzyme family)
MPQPLLFSPIELRDIPLKNRVVVAPMHQYSGVRGLPTTWHLMNVGRFAAGGAGTSLSERQNRERQA